MLVEFSVGNYRSFRETAKFSMVAANLKDENSQHNPSNVFAVAEDISLLKSAAVYGANASGKSNLVQALAFMRWFIINSSRETQSTDTIGIEPFRLSTETDNQASFFEIIFYMGKKRYRYGFEINQERVMREWLFHVPKIRKTCLFERDKDNIKPRKAYDADGIQQRTRSNALFLSVSAQFNVKLAAKIISWISNNLKIISGINNSSYFSYTLSSFLNGKNSKKIIQFINKLDLGINDIRAERIEFSINNLPDNMPDDVKEFILKESGGKLTSLSTIHKKYDTEGNYISNAEFSLEENESEGTKKLFALSGPIFNTLEQGEILIVDELDARLHPLMSRAIVSLFNSNETNPKNAQLIFMTHDTNLLSPRLFRRDQVWFTEKDRFGGSSLYSLAEYNIQNNAPFESDYIKGRYGAIPYIGNLNSILSNDGETEKEI